MFCSNTYTNEYTYSVYNYYLVIVTPVAQTNEQGRLAIEEAYTTINMAMVKIREKALESTIDSLSTFLNNVKQHSNTYDPVMSTCDR